MKFFEYLSKNIAAKVATIVIAAVVIIGGFFLLKMNPFGWNINFLGISELKIDDTANVVEKIKKISEFTTACYYEEFVLKEEKKEASKLEGVAKFVKVQADSTLNEIVILSKGTVRAGYNLSNSTIIDWLHITPEEQKHLSSIIGKGEKRRRNLQLKEQQRREAGKPTREQYLANEAEQKQERMLPIIEAIKQNPGLSQRALAKLTGFSRTSIQRAMAELQ